MNKSSNLTNIIGWVVVVAAIVVVGVGVVLNQQAQNKVLADVLQVTASDHVTGNADATVVVTEYSDYQCPFCAAAQTNISRLKEDFGDRVKFVFRNFPLTSTHPNALAAAYAAEAAALQDKFTEMHDILFIRQAEWEDSDEVQVLFVGYAEGLELDVDKFTADMASEAVINKVQDDMSKGEQIGIVSTPTFFVNNRNVGNPVSYEEFAQLLEAEL